ncbi:hypothetical protein Tco_1007442, partial [Tanacetum coccineum]
MCALCLFSLGEGCRKLPVGARVGSLFIAVGLGLRKEWGPSSGFFFLQSVGDPIVPKFDMHIYTSVPTVDEVNNLIKEYAVPLDLRPGVPPSTLTMNNLPEDKIVATSMSQFLKFLMSEGVRIGKGTALAANEHEDERVLAVQRKAQAAKDKAAGKRSAAG